MTKLDRIYIGDEYSDVQDIDADLIKPRDDGLLGHFPGMTCNMKPENIDNFLTYFIELTKAHNMNFNIHAELHIDNTGAITSLDLAIDLYPQFNLLY